MSRITRLFSILLASAAAAVATTSAIVLILLLQAASSRNADWVGLSLFAGIVAAPVAFLIALFIAAPVVLLAPAFRKRRRRSALLLGFVLGGAVAASARWGLGARDPQVATSAWSLLAAALAGALGGLTWERVLSALERRTKQARSAFFQ